MLADRDVEKANRVMKAIMEMDKMDIAAFRKGRERMREHVTPKD
jgi:hypothetical protein